MTQTVTAADGTVHEFPDEATPEMISEALGLASPTGTAVSAAPQQTGLQRYVAGAGSALAKGVAVGLGLPGDLESGAGAVGNWLAPKLGLTHTAADLTGGPLDSVLAASQGLHLPTSRNLTDLTGGLGLTDRSDLVPGFGPSPEAERLGNAAIEGVGTALPMLPIGGMASPLTTLASGASAGAAGEAAHELLPDSKLAPIAAGLAAGTGVQGLKSLLSGDVPERVAKALGTSSTLQDAGIAAQDSAREWLAKTLPAKVSDAWAPVDKAMASGAAVPLTNFTSTLKDITTDAGTMQPLVKMLRPSAPERLLDALVNKTPVGVGVSPSWQEAAKLRTAIGDAMQDPKIFNDVGSENLKKLYAGITADMQPVAASRGVGDAFTSANAETSRLYNLAEGPMSKLVSGAKPSASDPQPEVAAKRLLAGAKTGGSDLATLRGEMPDAVDELAAAHLRTSPEQWKKLSPEGQEALVPSADHRSMLADALPDKNAKPSAPASALHALVGEGVSHALSVLAGHLYGAEPNSLLPGAMGDLVGLAAPSVWRGIKETVKNPRLARQPLVGAAAGSNALLPNPNDTSR
jgi:hypothetical protein